MSTEKLDYGTVINQSYCASESGRMASTLVVSPSGSLLEDGEIVNSTYSSTMDTETGLTVIFDDILQKRKDFIREIYTSYIDTGINDINEILPALEEVHSNMQGTIENFKNCLNYFDKNFFSDFTTEAEFDEDGELILEWYGRIGARVNLTFGKNAELYFISLFHGESTKSKLFINRDSANMIKTALDKLYKDKVS